MTVINQTLIRRLEHLPAGRLAEVMDFVEFPGCPRSPRGGWRAIERIAVQARYAGFPPLTDDEIEAEIRAARQERAAR